MTRKERIRKLMGLEKSILSVHDYSFILNKLQMLRVNDLKEIKITFDDQLVVKIEPTLTRRFVRGFTEFIQIRALEKADKLNQELTMEKVK